jgi:hypothetical protein
VSLLGAIVVMAEKTPAAEGKGIITVMLVVGLIFLSVVSLGQLGRWFSHRRRGH